MQRKQNVWPQRVICASMIKSKQIGHKKSAYLFSDVLLLPLFACDRFIWWRLVSGTGGSMSMADRSNSSATSSSSSCCGCCCCCIRPADDDADAFNPLNVLFVFGPLCGDNVRRDILGKELRTFCDSDQIIWHLLRTWNMHTQVARNWFSHLVLSYRSAVQLSVYIWMWCGPFLSFWCSPKSILCTNTPRLIRKQHTVFCGLLNYCNLGCMCLRNGWNHFDFGVYSNSGFFSFLSWFFVKIGFWQFQFSFWILIFSIFNFQFSYVAFLYESCVVANSQSEMVEWNLLGMSESLWNSPDLVIANVSLYITWTENVKDSTNSWGKFFANPLSHFFLFSLYLFWNLSLFRITSCD